MASNLPPPPPGFQIQASGDGADIDHVAQLYHQAVAAGNDIAAQHFLGYLQAHAASVFAPDAQTQAKVDDIQRTQADANTALGNGIGGSIAGAGLGLVHHLANIPIGVAQLGVNAAAKVGDVVSGTPSPSMSNLVTGAQPQRTGIAGILDNAAQGVNKYVQSREQNYQDITKGNVGSYVGGTVGEITPWVVGVGELRAAGMLPKAAAIADKAAPFVGARIAGILGKAVPLATEGVAMGAAQPVTNGGADFGTQKALQVGTGAVLAPVTAAAGAGAAKAVGTARNAAALLTDKGQSALADSKVANILGQLGDRDAIAAQLRAAPRTENVSIAQALKTPRAVQAERVLRNDPNAGPAFVEAQNANNAQRLGVIRELAGTSEQMDAAVNARRAMANEFTGNNLAYLPPAQRWQQAGAAFQDMLDKPSRMPSSDTDALRQAQAITRKVQNGSMQEDDAAQALDELRDGVTTQKGQSAFDAAQQSIDQRMIDPRPILDQIAMARNTGLGQNSTVKGAMAEIAQAIQKAQDTRGLVPADMLDGIRQNMRKILANNHNAQSAVGTQEEAGVAPLKDAITQALNERIPGYSDYLASYRQQSVPINTMERVGLLLDANRAGGPNASGDQALTGPALKTFLRQNANSEYGISPEAQTKLESMRDALERERISDQKIAAAGPSTAADLKMPTLSRTYSGAVGRALGMVLGGGAGYGAHIPGAELPGAWLGNILGDKLAAGATKANANAIRMVGERTANAQSAAEALQRASQGKKLSKVQQALLGRLLPYESP